MSRDHHAQQQPEAALTQIQQLSQQLAAERDAARQAQAQLQGQLEQQQRHIAQLEAQANWLQWIINTSPAIAYSCQAAPPYPCTYVSQSIETILGYTPDEFKAEPDFWEQHLHPEDAPGVFAAIPKLFEQGKFQQDYRIRHQDNHYVWIRDERVLLRDAQGVPQSMVGYLTDISEQKRLDAERKQSEQRVEQGRQHIADENRQFRATLQAQEATYRHLFDCNPQPMWVYDLETLQFLAVNDAAIAKYGYSRAEFLAMTIADIRPTEDVPRLLENVAQVASGLDMAGIWQHCLRDGQIIQVEIVSYALAFEGRWAELVMAQDVTQRVKAEQALQDLNRSLEQTVAERAAALHKSQAELQTILNSSPFKIYVEDLEGRYIFVNQTFVDIFDCTQADILGKTVYDVFPADIANAFRANEQLLMAQGGVQQFEEVVRANGEERIFLSNKFLLRNDQGEVYALCGMSTDITDRKAMEVDLQESRDRLQAMLAAVPDHVFRVNRQGLYLDAYPSDSTLEITGLDTLVGRTMTEVLPPDVAHAHLYRIEKALSTQTIQVSEQPIDVDGARLVREVRVAPCGPNEVLFVIRDITDRKEAEAQLNRQMAAIEAAIDGIAITQNGHFLYLNRAHLDLFGYTHPEELIGQSWTDLYSPEEQARLAQEVWPGLERDGAWVGEATATRKDGTTFDQRLSLTLTEDGPVICVCEDISDRKHIEAQHQQLLQELAGFKLALDESAIVAVTDAQGVIVNVNDRFCEMLGYSRQELIGQPHRLVNWGYHSARYFRDLWRTISSGQVWRGEICNRAKDDTLYWVDSTLVPFLDSEAQPERYLAIQFDITDRKQAEAALRQSEEELRLLINASSDVVYRMSADWREMRQLDGKDFIVSTDTPNHSWIETYLPPVEQPRVRAAIQNAIQTQSPFELEHQIIKQDGTLGWTFSRAIPVLNQYGDIVEWFGTASDISDRKQAELDLQCTNAELARATRLKDEFLANMSHELRTPLNAILGMTEGLQEEVFGPLTDRQRRSLTTIETSSNHLLSLINDVLDVAKIEAGQLELDYAAVNVRLLCDSSLTLVKQQAHKKRLHLETQIPSNLPDLYGDERRLRQMLVNLLSNAVKFTPEGGRITVTVSNTSLTREKTASNRELIHPQSEPSATVGILTLSVADTGIGISPENAKKLFQPFVQIDSALNRQHQGTGLGLALVKRITEIHGGKVVLTSAVGSGSCFTLQLPILAIPSGNSPATAPIPSLETIAPLDPATAPLILLAEDNDANVNTTTAYLTAKGYHLVVANDGIEAVNLAASANPDLILMDIQMPQLDGLAAIGQIRQNPDLANVPIVAITALAMPDDQERCLAAGADDYISKPIRLRQLSQVIQTLLAKRATDKRQPPS